MLSVLRFVLALLYIYVGVCWIWSLQPKSTDNLAVNCSTEETICASGRLASYLYLSCSAGRINLYAKVGIYYTHYTIHIIIVIKIIEWAKYIWMLASIQIYKYLTVSPSTNNNLEVLRTSMRQNTPTQSNGDLHAWPGSQCLLIPKLNRVGQAQGQLNGSQTIQQMSW